MRDKRLQLIFSRVFTVLGIVGILILSALFCDAIYQDVTGEPLNFTMVGAWQP